MGSNANLGTNLGQGLSDLGQIIDRLIGVQRTLSEEMLKLVGDSSDALTGAMTGLMRGRLGSCCGMPKLSMPQMTSSCCDIPEPCWMPRLLGEFSCQVCAGSPASIRLCVTNEDIRRRTFTALASGPAAGEVAFAPSSLALGPKERGSITATLTLPASAADHQAFEAIIWLRGCRDYYLRWTVTAGSRSQCCAHEVCVCDGPDNILHWYDHFYCPRPCLDEIRQG
ncbi:MAG TPA: hypothetical protein VME92_11600 [Acetobacteraceae bacterium]|nr:hypothetical protein [Acetobacteraceae bacterium]